MKLVLACGFLALASWLTWRVCRLVDAGTALAETTARTVAILPAQVDAVRLDLDAQIAATRSLTDRQVTALRAAVVRLADVRSAEALRIVDARTGQALTVADTRTAALTASVEGVRSDLAPTLANMQGITEHANEASAVLFRRDALPAQLLGVLGGAKETFGQTAQTMRTVERAMPQLLATAQALESNSNETTGYSAQLLRNLAVSSKPLPIWARLALVAAPPITQTGFTIASWAALRGK